MRRILDSCCLQSPHHSHASKQDKFVRSGLIERQLIYRTTAGYSVRGHLALRTCMHCACSLENECCHARRMWCIPNPAPGHMPVLKQGGHCSCSSHWSILPPGPRSVSPRSGLSIASTARRNSCSKTLRTRAFCRCRSRSRYS